MTYHVPAYKLPFLIQCGCRIKYVGLRYYEYESINIILFLHQPKSPKIFWVAVSHKEIEMQSLLAVCLCSSIIPK